MHRHSLWAGFVVILAFISSSLSPARVNAEPFCDVPNPPLACDRDSERPRPDHVPFGWLDEVSRQSGQLRIRGWAIDPDTTEAIAIHVYADDTFVGGWAANQSRPD